MNYLFSFPIFLAIAFAFYMAIKGSLEEYGYFGLYYDVDVYVNDNGLYDVNICARYKFRTLYKQWHFNVDSAADLISETKKEIEKKVAILDSLKAK